MHKFPLKEIELFEPEVDGNWEEKLLPWVFPWLLFPSLPKFNLLLNKCWWE
jgi:hypothetical protein